MKLTKALSLGFAALVTLAQIAKAGTPLICHALNIGGAKSLPWNNDVWSLSGKTDYGLSRLVADSHARESRNRKELAEPGLRIGRGTSLSPPIPRPVFKTETGSG